MRPKKREEEKEEEEEEEEEEVVEEEKEEEPIRKVRFICTSSRRERTESGTRGA